MPTAQPVHTGPFTPTAADMEAVHYGIAVCHIGEDGDMLALGHHAPYKALAAFNRHARVFVGLANLFDDRSLRVADVIADIAPKWATFAPPDPELGEDRDCPWYAHWDVDGDAAGAVPVMYLHT